MVPIRTLLDTEHYNNKIVAYEDDHQRKSSSSKFGIIRIRDSEGRLLKFQNRNNIEASSIYLKGFFRYKPISMRLATPYEIYTIRNAVRSGDVVLRWKVQFCGNWVAEEWNRVMRVAKERISYVVFLLGYEDPRSPLCHLPKDMMNYILNFWAMLTLKA